MPSEPDPRLPRAEALHARFAALLAGPPEEPAAEQALSWSVWPSHHVLTEAARELFAALTGEPLVGRRVAMPWKRRLYNFVTDDVHLTADGEHGLVVAHDCFGALPGDGVDIHFHLLIPDGTHVTFHAGTDYTQSRLTVRATGPSAAHAVAVTASALEQVRDTARGGG